MSNKRALFTWLLLLSLLVSMLAACGQDAEPTPAGPTDLLDEVMTAGKLVVSTDPNYAPQSFLNDDGELDGFDVDVAKEVARRLGVDIEFATPDWDLITAGSWGGRWDVSIGSMTPTEDRSEVLWFTQPYYYTPASFAVHKENTSINSVQDLPGKRIGFGTATTYEAWMEGGLAILGGEVMYDPPANLDLKPYSTDSEAIQDLALGDGVRLDAVISAQPTIQEAINNGEPLKYVGTPAFYEPLAFSLDKGRGTSTQMLSKLDEILTEMHADGTLTALSIKWYDVDLTQKIKPPSEEPDLLDEVMAAGKLVVSTDPNYAPQSFLNDDGELDGFDVEVAKEVARRLGVDIEFTTPDWDLITAGSWGERWDVSIGSMTPTEDRSEVLWFTQPYYYTPASFAVHKENTSINSVQDLSGQRIGFGTATTYEAWMEGGLAILGGEVMYDPPADLDLKPYSTDSEAIQDLALGDGVRLDAVISAQPTIQEAINSGVPLKYVGTPAFYEPLAFSLDKGRGPSMRMLSKLDEILTEMHADGTLTALSLKWYGVDITQKINP